jgi:putative transposase
MRKRPGPDQIAKILREVHVNQACRKVGYAPTTYYRWKSLQENPASIEQVRVSELEAENGRLKLLVAELALDRRMLREALKKKP